MTGFILKLVPDDESRAIGREIVQRLAAIEEKLMSMQSTIESLIAQVAAMGTVTESVVTVVNALCERITQANGDPVQIEEAVTAMRAMTDQLSAAVIAGTAAAGEPVTPVG
jgi:uncharacterized coiled-coil protein SlyX